MLRKKKTDIYKDSLLPLIDLLSQFLTILSRYGIFLMCDLLQYYSQTPPQADTVTVTYHLVTHNDRAYIPAAFKTRGKIPSVKLDRPSSSPLSLNRTERSSDNNSYDVACQQYYEHISLRSRPTWCLSIHIFKYIHNLVFQITMSDTSIRLGLRLSS